MEDLGSKKTDKLNGDDSMLPVLIVGAGPIGLTLSILLSKLGIKCVVVEKRKEVPTHPQAHVLNNRTMEIFRKLDGLIDDIYEFQAPVDTWRHFVYCTSLTGRLLGSVDHFKPEDLDPVGSPVSIGHLKQYKLNELLAKKLEKLRVIDGGVKSEVLRGHECTSIKVADDGVTATVKFDDKEGRSMEKEIDCKFVVGADGGRSTVRKLLGIGWKGEREFGKFVSIHFFAQELGQYLMKERPGMLLFIFNPEATCIFVAHDLPQGEFVLQVPFYPPQQKIEEFTREACERIICKAAGREVADLKILTVKPWTVRARCAERFLSYGNRVILAGDAAHELPPTAAWGMNTGIHDAHNLAWKLASVLQGIAPLSFLSTYEIERLQMTNFNITLSLESAKKWMGVDAALGLNPIFKQLVHLAINSTPGSILPSGVQKAMLYGMLKLLNLQLSERILNEKNPIGRLRLF